MGEEELYEFYRDTYKVHGLHWNESLSRQVLEAWQRMFTQVRSQVHVVSVTAFYVV